MSDTRTIEQMVNDSVAKFLADYDAAHRPIPPTPEEEIAERLSRARFRESIGEQALLHGVRPRAIRHVTRDAEAIFELRDSALVAREGATDPGDPLAPLTPTRWLQALPKTDGYLFTAPGPDASIGARRNSACIRDDP